MVNRRWMGKNTNPSIESWKWTYVLGRSPLLIANDVFARTFPKTYEWRWFKTASVGGVLMFYSFTMLNHKNNIIWENILYLSRTCFQSSCVIFEQQNVDVNPGMEQFVQVLRAWMPFVPLHGVMEITLPWRWGCFGWENWWGWLQDAGKSPKNLPSSWWQMGTLFSKRKRMFETSHFFTEPWLWEEG